MIFLRKYFFSIISISLSLTLFLLPASEIKKIDGFSFPNADKIIHFFLYFVMSYAVLYDYQKNKKKPTINIYLSVFIVLIFLGIFVEFIQDNCISGRFADFYDVLANTVGISIGLIFYKSITKILKQHLNF